MTAAEILDKKLRDAGFNPLTVRTSGGVLEPVFNPDLTDEQKLVVATLTAEALNEVRIADIYSAAQAAKNASLGKSPEEIAETLKLQVNMGLGGLLLMQKQLHSAMGTLLIGSNVCSVEQFEAAFQAALTDAEHEAVAIRLLYWNWINAVDAKVQACITNPALPVTFPTPPQLTP